MLPDTPTSQPLTGELFPDLTSSAAGSRAKTSRTLASGRVLQGAGAGYGWNFGEPLCHFDHATSSWRTSQHSMDGGLIPFSATWPRAGTMRNGIVCPQRPLVPRISANASSLWRTPTAEDCQNRAFARNSRGEPKLSAQVKLWPTPRAGDGDHGGPNSRDSSGRPALSMAVHLWPTPGATEGSG